MSKTESGKRLAISFSGGRTSAVMTKLCVDKLSDTHEIAICFANTGSEHPATLEFVRDCQDHFGWDVHWIEAVVNPEKGKGIRHKKVSFETASRNNEPFEAYIAKYGLPGPTHPQCTSRLKEDVMDSWRHRELGWKRGSYDTAIGIRADEADRISSKHKEKKLVYPLVSAGWTKADVKNECSSWPFDLQLSGEHWGNCTWCWKKSLRKLLTLAVEDETVFDFPARMEELYQVVRPRDREREGRHSIFRGEMSALDIVNLSKTKKFTHYVDSDQENLFSLASFDVELDSGSACGESCEIGSDD